MNKNTPQLRGDSEVVDWIKQGVNIEEDIPVRATGAWIWGMFDASDSNTVRKPDQLYSKFVYDIVSR
ncbi:MAG: hypothetical protein LBK70_00375 [Clostridiales bacterium]|jgi:hypothetical protein|nr:hypothetical protein [Clostridiales bacterium]